MVVFDSIYLIAMAAWVGSILFFSFGVTPVVSNAFGAESGGKFIQALSPPYYLWGAISGAVALPSAVAVPLAFPELRGPWVGIQALVILAATLITLYTGNSLTPAINAARDAGPVARDRFDRLNRRSVRLNRVVLILGIGLLIAFASRPRPKTAGIIELTPTERAAARADYLRRNQPPSTEFAKPHPDHPGHSPN